jgi:hypothetical protein
MIHLSVLVGPDIFAALEIEAQEYRNPGVSRPADFSLSMLFLNCHGDPPCVDSGQPATNTGGIARRMTRLDTSIYY